MKDADDDDKDEDDDEDENKAGQEWESQQGRWRERNGEKENLWLCLPLCG